MQQIISIIKLGSTLKAISIIKYRIQQTYPSFYNIIVDASLPNLFFNKTFIFYKLVSIFTILFFH